MSFAIGKDCYSIAMDDRCDVVAATNMIASHVWFRTPALEQDLVSKIVQIQLEIQSRDQGRVPYPDAGSWSWFDIIILESPEASTPKVKNGLALAWLSHNNALGERDDGESVVQFKADHDIFRFLEAGDSIAVRVCARFPGWENHASQGRIVIRTSEKGRDAQSSQNGARVKDLEMVAEQFSKFSGIFDQYLDDATPAGTPPAYSLVRELVQTGPLRADKASPVEGPPLRLLSLDGGGVRGISSLYILQAIMLKLTNDPNTKPSKYFHMIAGTSTGGLIAIMLGRLQMTVEECISEYLALASRIFNASGVRRCWNLVKTGARHTADNFEKELKKLIKRRTGDENALMLDGHNECKVFVVAGQSQNMNNASAEHFRTYYTEFLDKFAKCTIWQAARATSAAPTYLPSIKIGDTVFVDGGIRFNNPSILLMGEANAVYGAGRHVACFLTIGTGMQSNTAIDPQPKGCCNKMCFLKTVISAAISIATDCEATHHLAKPFFNGMDGVYWRFNVGVRVSDKWASMISLDNYKNMPTLVDLTKMYIGDVNKRIEQCASKLVNVPTPTL